MDDFEWINQYGILYVETHNSERNSPLRARKCQPTAGFMSTGGQTEANFHLNEGIWKVLKLGTKYEFLISNHQALVKNFCCYYISSIAERATSTRKLFTASSSACFNEFRLWWSLVYTMSSKALDTQSRSSAVPNVGMPVIGMFNHVTQCRR